MTVTTPLVPHAAHLRDIEHRFVAGLVLSQDFLREAASQITADLFGDDLLRKVALHCVAELRRTGNAPGFNALDVLANEAGVHEHEITALLAELSLYPTHVDALRADLRALEERRSRLSMQTELRRMVIDADNSAEPLDGLVARARAMADAAEPPSLVPAVTLADLLQMDPCEEIDEIVRTGHQWWDRAMPDGALRAGDKVVIGGQPGVGKTNLALQLMLGALLTNPDLTAVWAAGEMSLKVLRNRMLAQVSGLAIGALRRPWADLTPEQDRRKREAIETLKSIGDRLSFLTSPLSPRAIRERVAETGARWVVVDYLQLMKPDAPASGRREAVDSCLFDLVALSQERDLVLVLISDSPKPNGARWDIYTAYKESSEIGFACDLAFVGEYATELDDDEDRPEAVEIRWRSLKARHGRQTNILTRFRGHVHFFEGLG